MSTSPLAARVVTSADTGCVMRVAVQPSMNPSENKELADRMAAVTVQQQPRTFVPRGNNRRIQLYHHGRRWYQRLVKKDHEKTSRPLMADYSSSEIEGHYLVAWDTQGTRLFSLFDTCIEFVRYRSNIPVAQWMFHEIILKDVARKPYFDIDIKKEELLQIDPTADLDNTSEYLKNMVIRGILANIPGAVLEKHVLVYTSHSSEANAGTETDADEKRSYHIIVDGYCMRDNAESKALYQRVIKDIPVNLQRLVDHQVYGVTQSFRTLGSTKSDGTRRKLFCPQFTFDGVVYTHLYTERSNSDMHQVIIDFKLSCVTLASACVYLPSMVDPESERKRLYVRGSEITEEQAQQALNLLAASAGITVDDPRFPYTIAYIRDGIIALKRHRPSRCRMCDRVHENMDPFMTIVGKNVFWYCRRRDDRQRIFVGQLDGEGVRVVRVDPTKEDEDEEYSPSDEGPGELVDPDDCDAAGDLDLNNRTAGLTIKDPTTVSKCDAYIIAPPSTELILSGSDPAIVLTEVTGKRNAEYAEKEFRKLKPEQKASTLPFTSVKSIGFTVPSF